MALIDEVKARYTSARLIQLTNRGDKSASTIDDTLLGKAVTDAEAEFQMIAGVAYDNTLAIHVAAGVKGVIALLYAWGENPGTGAEKMWDDFEKAAERAAMVTGRNRVKPTTSSVLTPTSERQLNETVRPDTDRPNYEDLIPDAPQ